MHPSLAMLDSAAEAQLAFAQAGTTISYLVDNWGGDALVELILAIKETNDYKVAISRVTGMDFETFYQAWKDDLHSKGLQEKTADLKVKGVRISNNQEESDDDSEDLVDIDDKRARDHTRLGDLLRIRGRVRSSAYEYKKALQYDPVSPIISTRLASSLMSSGKSEQAREILDPVLEIYPDYVGLHMILGRIYMEKDNLSKAEEAFQTAIAINPFDPVIHDSLIYIYEKQGKKESADREREILKILLHRETANEQQSVSE
jgi:predicted Zn-dependent protease